MKTMIIKIYFIISMIFGCSNQSSEPDYTTENKMYVYSNNGNTFYLVDHKTFEVVKEIKLDVADTISIGGMTLSTNRDYLFFRIEGLYPSLPFGFAIYNINKEKLENVFFTDFQDAGVIYFISAQNNSEPGLIYIHFRDLGTYSYDLFKQNVTEFISDEHDFNLDKRIFHSHDGKWTVVKKNWEDVGYTELEFYKSDSYLHNLQFTLNQENKDSLRIYDFKFSNDNKIYVTFLPGPVKFEESNLGTYDLETMQLHSSPLKLPWSLSGYYLEYSPNRNEIYAVGNSGRFYIIDTKTYSIKDTINLTNSGEQSPILITPDDNYAFVSYPNINSIFVIELENRSVIKTINITKPYNMIIP